APFSSYPLGAALVLCRTDFRMVLPFRIWRGERCSQANGLRRPDLVQFSRLGDGCHLLHDNLEDIVFHGVDDPCGASDDTEIALRSGGRRWRRTHAPVLRDYAAAAEALDRRGVDFPHHHRPADLRHPLYDDGRWPRHLYGHARDVHSPEHRILPGS